MPYIMFHDYFPEIAERETRTVTILGKSTLGLPLAEYTLMELFCDEPACDCRRVMFYVVSSRRHGVEAVVAYGWESREFYAKWMGDDDALFIDVMQGPVLNLGSPESEIARPILQMIKELVLPDRAFVERVKRHYAMFRRRVDSMIAPAEDAAFVRKRRRLARRSAR